MRWIIGIVLIAGIAAVGWAVVDRLNTADAGASSRKGPTAAPVSVAPIERGRIDLRRVYSGTLEARARFVVAPKVGGRIERMSVDLGDAVQRGQVVAELDDAEFVQAVAQAEADLAVAEAQITEARNASEIAERELKRVNALLDRGVASESQLDTVRADQLAKAAAVKVAEAHAQRARSSLESAKIRLGYTRVTASWSDEDAERIVADRSVDAGETVTANTPLMTIVDLHPITGVVFATEKDYAKLSAGQPLSLTTDAYPGRVFEGKISRISPVFRETSRQARIELEVPNDDHLLKPGMFIRASVTLDTAEDAIVVPTDALVIRNNADGVFIVADGGKSVRWTPVEIGIRDGTRVQVTGEGLTGSVVTLGQQLIDDGSAIVIPNGENSAEKPAETDPEGGR